MTDMPKGAVEEGERKLTKYKSIMDSMTPEERNDPALLSNSKRIARIAKGSGNSERDVRELMNDYNKMKKFYTQFKNDRNMRKNLSKFMKK